MRAGTQRSLRACPVLALALLAFVPSAFAAATPPKTKAFEMHFAQSYNKKAAAKKGDPYRIAADACIGPDHGVYTCDVVISANALSCFVVDVTPKFQVVEYDQVECPSSVLSGGSKA